VFAARYGLIPYIKHVTFRLLKVNTLFLNTLYQTSLISGGSRLNHLVMLTKETWPSFVRLSINRQYSLRLVLHLETRVRRPPPPPGDDKVNKENCPLILSQSSRRTGPAAGVHYVTQDLTWRGNDVGTGCSVAVLVRTAQHMGVEPVFWAKGHTRYCWLLCDPRCVE
jgi:hypothetical protein